MKNRIFIFLAFLMLTPSFAAGESISIILKPTKGLSGTTSFNIHEDEKATVLKYESPTKITEQAVDLESGKIAEIIALVHEVFEEVISTKNYDTWPERRGTFSIAITEEKVTKSISTRRYSKKMIHLIKSLHNISPLGESFSEEQR